MLQTTLTELHTGFDQITFEDDVLHHGKVGPNIGRCKGRVYALTGLGHEQHATIVLTYYMYAMDC